MVIGNKSEIYTNESIISMCCQVMLPINNQSQFLTIIVIIFTPLVYRVNSDGFLRTMVEVVSHRL